MELTELIADSGHEQVVAFAEEKVGLRGFVAIHSTALGPALGGIRLWHYADDDDALVDVMRLSEAMTRKSAVAGLRQGGGKAVVHWDDPHHARDETFRRALGRAIHLLGGRYIAAEDVGATQADMDGIACETPWVTGIDPAQGGSGDPSPVTAWGVLHGVHAVCAEAFGSREVADLRVVIQGVGKVGAELTRLLVERGARVTISDVDTAKVARVGARHEIDVVPPQHVLETECDVLAPCALGGVVSVETVEKLRCAAICGAANNQLVDDAAGAALAAAGIVYAPDYVVNAGGIINIAHEWSPHGYSRERAYADVERIEETTARVFTLAADEQLPPSRAADLLADRRIATEGGAPYVPGDPSVMRDALLTRWALLRTSPPLPSP